MIGHIENITAGENITAPAWVYISSGDGKAYKASASSTSNPAIGLVFANATANASTQILFSGVYEWPSASFTPGAAYYLSSSTAGAMTTTAPTNVQRLGTAVGSTRIEVEPQAFSPAAYTAAYKVYHANITQSGTSAPTAVVLENTLGVTPTWARTAVGTYTLTASSAWVTNKTSLPDAKFEKMGEDEDWGFTTWRRTSAHELKLETRTLVGNGAIVEMEFTGEGFSIEIRVYN